MANLYIVRTAIGRESQVVDFLSTNAKRYEGVYSIVYPHGMSGYIIVEADSDQIVKQISYKVPYVRGVLTKALPYEEIEHLIEFKPEDVDVHVGDIVSIIAGPFKGEKAKVTRVNTQKSEVILELLEAAVPIPITINLDSIKIIDKKEVKENE